MTLKAKYVRKHDDILKDTRPKLEKWKDDIRDPSNAIFFFIIAAVGVYAEPLFTIFADLILLVMTLYFVWLMRQPDRVPFKLPKSANEIDPHHRKPNGSLGMAEGILYLGNSADGEEIWFNNNDARTHMLYLGTTGAGKTFGLKSIVCNALTWSSGFVYIDGKADTDLWSTLSALSRRFGRDDDLLIMNYMTGNASGKVPSNTLNPFSTGSASYLVNMLTSLMPDSGGDNAMWKDRAVALISAIMPCLVWKRENQNIPLSIGVIRQYLTFQAIIKLSRDKQLPELLRKNVKAYLDELPGYVDDAFDDKGEEKKDNQTDTSTPRQQHGFLSMQFTRAMSSLGEDYGFIFDTQAADVDMNDVVLNRRLLVTLIPALEKSGDETANLGKIISASLKGMMGATLGNTVEGDTATAIENKPTTAPTPFIAVFDEVGYYAAQGMAVMAAQARSLGFCLVFAGQDMPALEKRVKEEAKSITANCNIKLFGKLEDPTQTKDFFEKSVGQSMVTEVSGFEKGKESANASIQLRSRASYSELKFFQDGQAICTFGKALAEIKIYFHDIGHAKSMRVQRFLPITPPSEDVLNDLQKANNVVEFLRSPKKPEIKQVEIDKDIEALAEGFGMGLKAKSGFIKSGIFGLAKVASDHGLINVGGTKTKAATIEKAELRAEPKVEETAVEEVATLTAADLLGTSTASITEEKPAEEVPALTAADLLGTSTGSIAEEKPDEEAPALTAADLLGAPAPKAEEVPTEKPEEKVEPAETAEAPVEINKQPISWADLIGAEEPEQEEAKIEEAPVAQPVEQAVVDNAAPAETVTPEVQPISWAQLIGADEPAIEQPQEAPVIEQPVVETPQVQEAVVEEVVVASTAVEQPEVVEPVAEVVEVREEVELSDEEAKFETVTWQQLIGAEPEETPVDNSQQPAYHSPEQPPSAVISDQGDSVNDDEGSDQIQAVSWSDIVGSSDEDKSA